MGKRATFKNVRKKRFTQVGNDMLWDTNLTLQAKGLLSIFLSNSEEWELNMKEIIKRSKNGRDAHYRIVKELIKHGYFARVEFTDQNNRFENMVYIFSDIKFDVEEELEHIKDLATREKKIIYVEYKGESFKINPFTESQDTEELFPFTESQDTESQLTRNQDINNTNSNNTNSNNKPLDTIDTHDNEHDNEKEYLGNKKERYIKKAFYENTTKGSVPKDLANTLEALCRTIEEADLYYKTILIAKKKASEDLNMLILFEEHPKMLSEINNTLARVIKKHEREKSIKDPYAYLYSAVYRVIVGMLDINTVNHERSIEKRKYIHSSKNSVYFDWLNE